MQEVLLSALRRSLESVSLLRRDATLLAAVSGGMDSVALLHALVTLRQEVGYRLYADHVNHGLRGFRSDEDLAFVKALCKDWDVPLQVHHAQLPGGMHATGVENRARQARRRFFLSAMEELQADALLLAHHQDDQAETVLMRLLRGAGALGLGGMREAQPFGGGLLLRPFLSLSRPVLHAAMQHAQTPWREDESNADPCCLRNRLRLRVMPMLESIQPQASLHLAQSGQLLQWDEACLHAQARELFLEAQVCMPGCFAMDLSILQHAPPAIALRVLRMWFGKGMLLTQGAIDCPPPKDALLLQRGLSFEDSLRLYDVAQGLGQDSVNLPGGLSAIRTGALIHLLRQNGTRLLPMPDVSPQALALAQTEYCLASHRFSLSPMETGPQGRLGISLLPLTSSLLMQGLTLRFPLPADHIHPFGASGGKSLRRYFIDRKVAAPFRATWPVLVLKNEVLWVPQVGAAEATRIPQDSQEVWALELQSTLPYPLLPFDQTVKEHSP